MIYFYKVLINTSIHLTWNSKIRDVFIIMTYISKKLILLLVILSFSIENTGISSCEGFVFFVCKDTLRPVAAALSARGKSSFPGKGNTIKGQAGLFRKTVSSHEKTKELTKLTLAKENLIPRKSSISRKLKFFKRFVYGMAGLAIATSIAAFFLWQYIHFDPYGGVHDVLNDNFRGNNIVLQQPILSGSAVNTAHDFVTSIIAIPHKNYLFDELKADFIALTEKFWILYDLSWQYDQVEKILAFLKNPIPIKSSSISQRWLTMRLKLHMIHLLEYITRETKNVKIRNTINQGLTELKDYTEILLEEDPLFREYFPKIDPIAALSAPIRELGYPESGQVVDYRILDDFFWVNGTPYEFDTLLKLIHETETTGIVRIPFWQAKTIARIREIDPQFKFAIEQAAQRHPQVPARLLLTMYFHTWKRSYLVESDIKLANKRGKLSKENMEYLQDNLPDWFLKYELPPDIHAFIGSVVFDAHATSGIYRYRPNWVRRYGGFDQLNEDSKNFSTRYIAWKLLDIKYSTEMAAVLAETLVAESIQAIENASHSQEFSLDKYLSESAFWYRGRFTPNDTERIAYYKKLPDPEVFIKKGESWMLWNFHPFEVEIQWAGIRMNPESYYPSKFLQTMLAVTRSGFFNEKPQKFVLEGINSRRDILVLKEWLTENNTWLSSMALETLVRISHSSRESLAIEARRILNQLNEKGSYYHGDVKGRTAIDSPNLDNVPPKKPEPKNDILGLVHDIIEELKGKAVSPSIADNIVIKAAPISKQPSVFTAIDSAS